MNPINFANLKSNESRGSAATRKPGQREEDGVVNRDQFRESDLRQIEAMEIRESFRREKRERPERERWRREKSVCGERVKPFI